MVCLGCQLVKARCETCDVCLYCNPDHNTGKCYVMESIASDFDFTSDDDD